jgi:hypothetical protein
MVGKKTRRSKPHTLKSVGTKKDAIKIAKEWKAEHPGRICGVYKIQKVKFYPTKK